MITSLLLCTRTGAIDFRYTILFNPNNLVITTITLISQKAKWTLAC